MARGRTGATALTLLRAIRFWPCAIVATIGVCLSLLVTALVGLQQRATAPTGRWWGHMLLFGAGVRFETAGTQAPKGRAYVIVPNHTSMLDIAIINACVHVDLRYVSRPFFFKVPILGWSMYLGGHVALDPKKPKAAARVLRNLGPMFEAGRSLVLFPEGTRTPDGTVQAYRRGPISAAIENGVPLLPVRIEGLFESLPRGRLLPRPSRAKLTIGEPIETTGLKPPDAKRLTKQIEQWARGGAGAETTPDGA